MYMYANEENVMATPAMQQNVEISIGILIHNHQAWNISELIFPQVSAGPRNDVLFKETNSTTQNTKDIIKLIMAPVVHICILLNKSIAITFLFSSYLLVLI